MKKIRIVVIIASVIAVIIIAFYGVNWTKRFFQIDACLDRGGRWNSELSKCEYSQKITSVRILHTPIATYSDIPIQCELFEYAFDKIIKEQTIGDVGFLEELEFRIDALSISKNSQTIDTRIKCFIIREKETDTLCVTNNGLIIYNGSLMKNDDELVNCIREKIYID